jgi:hypothetical protein
MKVPYAKKWQKETDKLRKIALDCDLLEELKWGKPCFTLLRKNVAIVIPLKESGALAFKGALLKVLLFHIPPRSRQPEQREWKGAWRCFGEGAGSTNCRSEVGLARSVSISPWTLNLRRRIRFALPTIPFIRRRGPRNTSSIRGGSPGSS